MTEELNKLAKKLEKSSKRNLTDYYNAIDDLYWELDYLNYSVALYDVKKLSNTDQDFRRYQCYDIRARIYEIYKDIKYYKECINFEKGELKRIYNTYGEFRVKYDDCSTYDYRYDENDLEEIKDYKYNIVRDIYE